MIWWTFIKIFKECKSAHSETKNSLEFELIILIYQTFSAPQQSVKPAWAEMEASSLLFATMELFGGKNVNETVSITLLTFSDDGTVFL